MTKKKVQVPVRIHEVSPEKLREWRQKEAEISADVLIQYLQRMLPPEQWSTGIDMLIRHFQGD